MKGGSKNSTTLTPLRFRPSYPIGPTAEQPFSAGEKLFDYLEMIEVTDLEEYRRDLEENPAAKAIAQQWGEYLDLVGSLQAEFIPPGFSRLPAQEI